MIKRITIRDILQRALIAGLLVCSATASALGVEEPFAKWFRYSGDLDAQWDFVGDPLNSMRLSIKPKKSERSGPTRRVLVLYPRASSDYDIAISEMLTVLETREHKIEFTVINFDLKDTQGEEAILFAEKNKFDLVFAMGSEATAWLYARYRGGAMPVG